LYPSRLVSSSPITVRTSVFPPNNFDSFARFEFPRSTVATCITELLASKTVSLKTIFLGKPIGLSIPSSLALAIFIFLLANSLAVLIDSALASAKTFGAILLAISTSVSISSSISLIIDLLSLNCPPLSPIFEVRLGFTPVSLNFLIVLSRSVCIFSAFFMSSVLSTSSFCLGLPFPFGLVLVSSVTFKVGLSTCIPIS